MTHQCIKDMLPILVAVCAEDLKEAVECVLQELHHLLHINVGNVGEDDLEVTLLQTPLQ